ncbi:hypothetical protein HNQ68_001037 [Pseudochrobactrum saccharolyticum]|uniref:Uncharacterized protein n=1 Tax=Pseudochrobactrum saccharolyticum TaxID=354352 RepID=A0A7W8EMJ6_9HYPH|nr:hypothetical protein [Pseudochrobactrum saccharolyticum]
MKQTAQFFLTDVFVVSLDAALDNAVHTAKYFCANA